MCITLRLKSVMKRLLFTLFLIAGVLYAFAQGSVRGKVIDKQMDESMQFVNVAVMTPAGKIVKGAITDATGQFNIGGLPDGSYDITMPFIWLKMPLS